MKKGNSPKKSQISAIRLKKLELTNDILEYQLSIAKEGLNAIRNSSDPMHIAEKTLEEIKLVADQID